MRKFLTKAIVALGVMASAMALSSVGVWAGSVAFSSSTNHSTGDIMGSEENVISISAFQDLTWDSDGFKKSNNDTDKLADGNAIRRYFTIETFDSPMDVSFTVNELNTSRWLVYYYEDTSGGINLVEGDGSTKVYTAQLEANKTYTVGFRSTSPRVSKIEWTSVAPFASLEDSVTLKPGNSKTLTAELKNSNETTLTYNWEITGTDNIELSASGNTATVAAKAEAQDKEQATVTVTIGDGTNTYTATSLVKVSNFVVDYNMSDFTDSNELFTNDIFSSNNTSKYVIYDINSKQTQNVKTEDGTETGFTKFLHQADGGAPLKLSNISVGDTIGIYYTATDSGRNAVNKAAQLQITSPDTTTNDDNHTGTDQLNVAYYYEFEADVAGDYTIKTAANRLVIWGINYTPAPKLKAGIYNGTGVTDVTCKIIVSGNDNVYVVAKKAIDENTLASATTATLKINDVDALSDTQLYKTVSAYDIDDLTANDGEYLLGVMITDVSSNTEVTALKNATVDIELS